MSSLHDKLYNNEVVPPGRTWEKIAAALDESAIENKFPQRLYNMEVPPPGAAWQHIQASLTQGAPQHTAPVRKLSPVLRYAAAAILIGIVAFGVLKLTVNTGKNETRPAVATGTLKNTDTGEKAMEIVPTEPANDIATLEPSRLQAPAATDKVAHKIGTTHPKSTRKSVTASYIQNTDFDPQLSQSIYAYADHVPDISDRYVMLLTPDGNIIRMAKKWSNLVCCVSGEEQDPNCKSQIKKWQEKIASSPIAPSPGNFMDILGLVSSLNDTNGL